MNCTIFHVKKFLPRWHQRLRPILSYMCILLSSHYGMAAGTAMDLYSCMSERERHNGRKLPFRPLA
jgi:hypothetical protein